MSQVWTEEQKQNVIDTYLERMEALASDEERAAQTVEIVKEIADEVGGKPNGIRMILSKAGVYVTKSKTASTKATGSASGSSGTKRVSKADAQQELINAINNIDPKLVDEELIAKLTGTAAKYFTGILQAQM